MERWGVDRVMALAPDSASQNAGRKLATPTPWSETGWTGNLLWGSCQGSGRTPYRVAIDLTGPSYKCSCPSRKFPCKHTLGLLFLWAEGRIEPGGGMSEFAAEWSAKREQRASKAEAEPKESTPEQLAQAEARAAQRQERVASGLAELDLWLADQLTGGLVAHTAGGYSAANRMAARMVDAQAGGVATRLRTLPLSRGSEGFAATVSELALIRLLIRANSAVLDDDLRTTVANHLGQPTPKAVALANPGIRDLWVVTGMKDAALEQVSARRVWLEGRQSGRRALVLSFSAGDGFDNSLLPGMVVDAELHYYPGRPQLRAALGTVHGETTLGDWRPGPAGITDCLAAWRHALAADPWITEWPVSIWGTLHAQPAPAIRDGSGLTMPALGTESDLVQFMALAGPSPTTWFGELSADGFAPTSVLLGDQVVAG